MSKIGKSQKKHWATKLSYPKQGYWEDAQCSFLWLPDFTHGIYTLVYFLALLCINDKFQSKSNICLGDCCLPKIQTLYCSDCICHEDGTRHPESLCPLEFIGNKFCSDENNIVECDYDGGKIFKLK